MMYYAVLGEYERRVMNFEGWELITYNERNLEDVERRVLRDMRERGAPFAVIFIFDSVPVRLSFLSLEEETVKALGRWF